MIKLVTGFECSNGKNIKKLADYHFCMEVEGDKNNGYCAYFCFDLINSGKAEEVTVDLLPDTKFENPTDFAFGSVFPTTIWIKPEGFHRYRPLRGQQPELDNGKVTIKVPVGANERLRVSLTYVAPYSEISALIKTLAEERSDRCKLFSIGQTVKGLDIVGLKTGKPGKPKIFCVAGQHSHEHAGVWGAFGIADFMSSLLPEALALREQFEVLVIPIVNADGNVMGTNAFNAEGLDIYKPAFGDNPDTSEPVTHEGKLLWKWVLEANPALWMNFHCYIGWQINSEFPYDGWYEVEDRSIFEDAAQRRIYDAVCDTLRLETDAPSTHEKASFHPESTFCYQLAKRYSIPHAFYEINNGTAGKHNSIKRGLHVFKRVTNTLLHCLK